MTRSKRVPRGPLTALAAAVLACVAACTAQPGGNAVLSAPLVVAGGGDNGSVCVIEPGPSSPSFRIVHFPVPGRCTSIVAWRAGLYASFEDHPSLPTRLYRLDLATGAAREVARSGRGLHSLVALTAGIFAITRDGIVQADPDRAAMTTVFPSASPIASLAVVGDELAFVPEPGKLGFLRPGSGKPEIVDLPGAQYVSGASNGIVLVRHADGSDRPFPRSGDSGSSLWQTLASLGRSPWQNRDRRLFDIDGEAWMCYEGSYFGPGDMLEEVGAGRWVRPPSRILGLVAVPASPE